MRKTIAIAIAVILSLMIFLETGSGCKSDALITTEKTQAYIWRVTSNTTTVYMLGSIHIASRDIYPLDSTIEDAFESSDYLAVEINVRAANKLQVALLTIKYGRYPEGQSREDILSEETYEYLVNRLHVPDAETGDLLDQYRPWVLYISSAQGMYVDSDYDPEYGIDMHFIDRADESGKEIIELETAEYQISQMSSVPDDAIIKAILDDLKNYNTEQDFEEIIDAWADGDLAEMTRIVYEQLKRDADIEPLYQKMYYERNLNMAAKIEELLSGDKVYFVVVGAGHFVGANGLVNLMVKSGYQVEQLYNGD